MSDLSTGPTAIVIGGGVIGLTSAWALIRQGYRVTVLERGAFARQASWAGGGILVPLPPWHANTEVWKLAQRSLMLYPALCAELLAETGIDPEWWRCGMDVFDSTNESEALLWCAQQGLACEQLARNRGKQSLHTIHLPWVAQIRNPRFCSALVAWLRARGVALQEHCGPIAIEVEQSRAVARHGHEQLRADIVVVAAGAWSGQLLGGVHWASDIRPVKGQMLALQTDGRCINRIVLSDGRYLIPRKDGVVLVGSTLEETGFDASTSAGARQTLGDFAISICEGLRNAPCIAHWAGLRPASSEGIPTIERHPAISNLYLNSGHYRYGLTMAPASAERLMSVIKA